MNHTITHASPRATLTQNQLFNLFLDAPYREGGKSALSAVELSENTMLERYFSYYGFETECLSEDLAEDITEALRDCDEPLNELEAVIDAFEHMARNLRIIRSNFEQLADEMRTEAPSADAPAEEYIHWEENPTYILAQAERCAA